MDVIYLGKTLDSTEINEELCDVKDLGILHIYLAIKLTIFPTSGSTK